MRDEPPKLAGFAGATPTPLLPEVDYGRDEGRTRDEIRAERPGWDFFTHGGGDGGETLDYAAARARQLFDKLAGVTGDVLRLAWPFLRVLTATYVGAAPPWGGHLAIAPAPCRSEVASTASPIASWNLSAPR